MPSSFDDLMQFGGPEAALPALPSKQAVTAGSTIGSYLTDVFTGKAAMQSLSNLGGGPSYDPAKTLSQNALDPAGLQTATNVALSTGPGMIGGRQAASRAAGHPAQPQAIEEAFKLEQAGKSPDEIYAYTGWYRGPDSQWKWVIPDNNATLKHSTEGLPIQPNRFSKDLLSVPYGTEISLGDVLNHSDLFKLYPWLKEIKVEPTPLFSALTGNQGYYSPKSNTIGLTGGKPETMLSTLLHEIQHAVQFKEGFGLGGSPSEFLWPKFPEDYGAVLLKWKEVEKQFPDDVNSYTIRHKLERDIEGRNSPSYADIAWDKLPDKVKNQARLVYNELYPLEQAKADAYQKYRNLAGEVESRATEQMLKEKDWSKMPSQLQDVTPAERQRVKFSVPDPVIEEKR